MLSPSLRQRTPLTSIRGLHIELGYACNVRCIMCFQENFTQMMDSRIWEKILLPVYPLVDRILIQGGEPTVLKRSRDLIALALSLNPGVKFAVMTNGLLFDGFWRETFVEHGYDVNFSINAAHKATHEAINVGSDYETVMKNLRTLIELRDKRGTDLSIHISCVILQENIRELADFVELAARLGVDVRFFYDATRRSDHIDGVEHAVRRALAKAREHRDRTCVEGLATFYGDYCRRKGVENLLKDEMEWPPPICPAPWCWLNVDRLGKARFCCMSYIVLGDVTKTPIEEIWNGRGARAFRRRMAHGDFRYCMEACSLNAKPNYRLDLVKGRYYARKFISEFKASPQLACRKANRKVKQHI